MNVIASALLIVGVFAYVFYPDRSIVPQVAKPLLEFLRERRDVLYDNLRDLNFEYRAGKYPEEDYVAQRAALENEAAQIVAEIGSLEGAKVI
jgi:F0F1-type ATP synthase membrane subunit b/b'